MMYLHDYLYRGIQFAGFILSTGVWWYFSTKQSQENDLHKYVKHVVIRAKITVVLNYLL